MRIGSLFSGYGGLDLAVESVLDTRTVWTCDVDPGASRILARRFPHAPNLGDITAIDLAGVDPVDILTGGFPCQDVSHAGRRAGLGPGTRTGLWSRMADAIDHLRPRLVVAENVRGLLSARAASDLEPCPWCVGDDADDVLRALGAVLGDLADLGYDAAWHGLRAADVGAPHGRFRVFVLAWPQASDTDRVDSQGGQAAGLEGEAGSTPRPVADADGLGSVRSWGARGRRDGSTDDRVDPAYSDRARLEGAQPTPCTKPGSRGEASADADGGGLERIRGIDTIGRDPDRRGSAHIAWGAYESAIRRWEHVIGREAPAPTAPGRRGTPRLNPVLVEWMMGLEQGWVTDVPGLSRDDQLRILGNGVVPQQAIAALRHLLAVRADALREAS